MIEYKINAHIINIIILNKYSCILPLWNNINNNPVILNKGIVGINEQILYCLFLEK